MPGRPCGALSIKHRRQRSSSSCRHLLIDQGKSSSLVGCHATADHPMVAQRTPRGILIGLPSSSTLSVPSTSPLAKRGGPVGVTRASPSLLRVTFFLPTVRVPELGAGEYGTVMSLRK